MRRGMFITKNRKRTLDIRDIKAKNCPFIKNRPVENLEIFKISIQFRKFELKNHAEGFQVFPNLRIPLIISKTSREYLSKFSFLLALRNFTFQFSSEIYNKNVTVSSFLRVHLCMFLSYILIAVYLLSCLSRKFPSRQSNVVHLFDISHVN